MPPRALQGMPNWHPRLRRGLRGKGYRKGKTCAKHHADACLSLNADDAPEKAPPDLERPDYWREVETWIYGVREPNGVTNGGAALVGHVIGKGPRLRCDYHSHFDFALDEMCPVCVDEDEEAAEDFSEDHDFQCRECVAEEQPE